MNDSKKLALLIALSTLLRLFIACAIELGNDEVYYRMYAEYPAWNYFDHPPMVGWLIRATTLHLWLDHPLFIRLGAIMAAALTTWLMFLCGRKIGNSHTGFLAALLYTCTVYGSIIAGTFILPDSPQMACWAACLYLLIHWVQQPVATRAKKRHLLLFGTIAGLGMLCKIHTVFLWLGLLLYILRFNRQWLKEPTLYLAGFITLALFYPVIQWNIDHGFVTYLYHSKRVAVTTGAIDWATAGSFAAGQLLYTNPILFVLIVLACTAAMRNRLSMALPHKRLLLACSLPLLGMAWGISFFKQVLPHWSGPAYVGLLLLTACWLQQYRPFNRHGCKRFFHPVWLSGLLLLLVVAAGLCLIRWMPGTLGSKAPAKLGEGDFTLDLYGWQSLRQPFAQLALHDENTGRMMPDAPLITHRWFPAAHIDYYVAMPLKREVLAIGDTNDVHQYIWINAKRRMLAVGADAYCIVPSNYPLDVKGVYGPRFNTIEQSSVIAQRRGGVVCRRFYIWRLKGYKGDGSR